MIDKKAITIATSPRLKLHRVQVRHIDAVNNVQAFFRDPARVGRFLFLHEFAYNVVRNERVFFHGDLVLYHLLIVQARADHYRLLFAAEKHAPRMGCSY